MDPTLAGALSSATARLAAASDAPRADAEELLGRLLGLTRAELYLERARTLGAEERQRLEAWLERRLSGEPVQYITGRAAFRGLDLAVSPAVLIPRPETEGLVEAVLQVLREARARWTAPRVLDLGTGSGAIALAIASECREAVVTATDASEDALALAGANAAACGLTPRVRFLAGDWFEALAPDERFEVIVANPPYIAESERDTLPESVRGFEPAEALFSGATGLEALREIADEAPRYLVADGLLALELAEMRANEVAGWLEGGRDWEAVTLRDDLAGRPRVLLARRQRGPAIAPAQWNEEG
ncbi:MAG: peptide chain release factor N(5)-glutamine methyltransferase [Candidatus Eisenbacteria bacterium]|uniref:Release factor glutamine methyltransferase n=1 Tax=Eiseniibacteriota bacterium TaxID=2212470 RepID=A0A538U864_UNCEI|nr:MAG: peptide chain release factor N(5)-glutamine methyltransferase [Candidatus Eisenbacteria bacterium]